MEPSDPGRRVIAHMDCDSFYASVELLRRPELRGRPVVVAGTGPRAVVTTASYEARRFGVHSAMPASHARRLCPTAVFIAPDFAAYRAKSKEVWEAVQDRLGCPMQQVSLDEAYLDITAIERPLPVLRALVAELAEQTGITVSVGVGPSRLVAKTASDWRKPACFAVLSREQACEVFAGSPARILQGVGPKTAERLARLGIANVGHLQAASETELIAHFGDRMGRWLKARARFYDDSPVESSRVAKSRSSETTFDEDVADLAELERVVRRLATEVGDGLQRRGTRGRTIGIKLRYDNWTNITRARTVEEYTNDTGRIAEIATALLRENAPARPVRLLGVRVASFQSAAGEGEEGVASLAALRVSQLRLPV
jgi:DNA polymerase-4